jgi:hypothetical protein
VRSSAFCLPNPQEPPGEVDVVPVEPQQLAPAQARVRHQREQEPIALRLAGEVALPQIVSLGLGEQPLELAHRQRVRQCLPLLRRSQRQCRVAEDSLLLDEEAEEALQGRGCSSLARHGRPALLLLGEEGAQVRDANFREVVDPPTLQVRQTRRNVTFVRRAGHRGKAPLRRAKALEIGQFLRPSPLHRSSSRQPCGPRWSEPED